MNIYVHIHKKLRMGWLSCLGHLALTVMNQVHPWTYKVHGESRELFSDLHTCTLACTYHTHTLHKSNKHNLNLFFLKVAVPMSN